MKRLTLIVGTFVLIATALPAVSAQRRTNPAVTLAHIHRDLVGRSVTGVPISGRNGQTGNWTFQANESREVRIIDRSTDGDTSTVTIHIVTQDIGGNGRGPTQFLRGNLELEYERVVGGWSLTQISGDDAILTLPAIRTAVSPQNYPRPAPQQLRTQALVNSLFAVAPGQFSWFPINLSSVATVSGRFRAQGGGGNDIEVFILDADALENYRTGHNVQTYFNSGRVTVGSINVRLNAGSYYLVFNNQFSILSNKAVSANVWATY